MGTEWHQEAVEALADMVREAARRQGTAWGVCRQIGLLETGARYPDGHAYEPRPDAMVLAQPLPWGGQASIRLADAGIPLFVAEVASKSTVGNDVGTKRELYEFIGVPEYIVFDAVGNVLSTPLLAWRMEKGSYVPWLPEANGAWRSGSLGLTVRPTQPLMSVWDRAGRPVEVAREVRMRADQLEQRLAEAEQRADRLERRLAEAERAREEEARRRSEVEAQLRGLRASDGAGPNSAGERT